jgi:hypothetical protein
VLTKAKENDERLERIIADYMTKQERLIEERQNKQIQDRKNL